MNIGPENETVEHKKSTSELKEGVASIASILNKHGRGELYFGVKNNGDVCGMQVSDSTLREISQTIGHSIEPRIYPSIEKLSDGDGRDYVRVSFEGDDAPYACKGTFRIRVSDEDVLMSMAEVRSYVRESESRRNPWDKRISNKTVADIDEPTLKAFVERGRAKDRITFDYTGAADVLDRLGLLEDGYLLNAGAALFCPSPDIDLKMGVLASHARTEIIGLEQEEGLLFDLVRKAEMFIVSNTRSRIDTSTAGPSPVYPEIPTAALHEGLMNAYAHRDWADGGAVVVDIYNDAIEITSPGWFIEGQDPESHLSGDSSSSKSRNDLIVKTLFRSGDIESYGTGIRRIKKLCDAAGIDVEYVHVLEGTKLIFHRKDAFGQSLTIGNSPNNGKKDDNRRPRMGSKEREDTALEIAAEEGRITTSRLVDAANVGRRTAAATLLKLKDMGKLEWHGRNPNDPDQYYTLS